MNARDFAAAVGVATLDFQGEALTCGTVSAPLATYLRTEAFPLNAPPALRNAPDYGGVKIFSYQEQSLCIAQFYDGGKKDRFQRAIASASVLVFPHDLLRAGFRNLRAVREFLADVALNAIDNASLSVLHSLFEEGSVASNEQALARVGRQKSVDYDLLAVGAGLLAAHRRLKICSPDKEMGIAFFELLFALAPAAFFDSIAWCTYASSLTEAASADGAAKTHEEVIVHTCRLESQREEKSWLGGMKTRLFGGDASVEPAVDLQSNITVVPDRKDLRFRLAQSLIYEIRDNRLQLKLDFEQRQALLLAVIGNVTSRTSSDLNLKTLLPDALFADTFRSGTQEPDPQQHLKDFLKEEMNKR